MSQSPSISVDAVMAALKPTACPVLPWFTREEIGRLIATPEGELELVEAFNLREKLIALADEETGEPFEYGFELPHWKAADKLLTQYDVLYCAGGIRSTKSNYAAKRVVQAALKYPKGVIWCMQETEKTSIGTQQKQIWKYLPAQIKRLNAKRGSTIWKVNYTIANGFADGKLVLPNRTEIHFLTYKQDPKDFQGWEIGAYVSNELHDAFVNAGKLAPENRGDETLVPNIGGWADESMTLGWLDTLLGRRASRRGKILWTFAARDGITQTIKQLLGAPVTIESRPAELLNDRVNIPGLESGHMPFLQEATGATLGRVKGAAIYFHTDLNVFGNNYEEVKKMCEGRDSAFVERNAYGYARDSKNRAFPLFGEVNVIKPEHLPAVGTNYMLTDPAGARNWATIWVRVAPGGNHYIYRDWPDLARFGEWAVAAEDSENQPDGVMGPAQHPLGYGVTKYKRCFWEEERVYAKSNEKDPYRIKLQSRMSPSGPTQVVSEDVQERFIDPRAGRNQHVAEQNGTCLIDEFEESQVDRETGATLPPMHFTPASGVHIEDGLSQINGLLYWNNEKPMCAVTNSPRLFVSANCQQVIWAMLNYTGRGGEKAGCKDYIDLMRYMAQADLVYLDPNRETSWSPGKGY